jgi:hypothetical protein
MADQGAHIMITLTLSECQFHSASTAVTMLIIDISGTSDHYRAVVAQLLLAKANNNLSSR